MTQNRGDIRIHAHDAYGSRLILTNSYLLGAAIHFGVPNWVLPSAVWRVPPIPNGASHRGLYFGLARQSLLGPQVLTGYPFGYFRRLGSWEASCRIAFWVGYRAKPPWSWTHGSVQTPDTEKPTGKACGDGCIGSDVSRKVFVTGWCYWL